MPGRKNITDKKTREVLLATRNRGKVREIRKLLKGMGVRIQCLQDLPEAPEVEEDGSSFAENALKKARFYAALSGVLTISDDSGVEVEALKGQPGVYSARYAGEGASDQDNNQKLLKKMEGTPASKRGASFKCSIAIVSPDGKEAVAEGSCKGKIGFREVGRRGFGYDPLFILPRYGKTMAQFTLGEKNKISHRGKALRKLRRIIRSFLG
jgi:XTP/dITP diphosphohydrolase